MVSFVISDMTVRSHEDADSVRCCRDVSIQVSRLLREHAPVRPGITEAVTFKGVLVGQSTDGATRLSAFAVLEVGHALNILFRNLRDGHSHQHLVIYVMVISAGSLVRSA